MIRNNGISVCGIGIGFIIDHCLLADVCVKKQCHLRWTEESQPPGTEMSGVMAEVHHLSMHIESLEIFLCVISQRYQFESFLEEKR